MTLELYLSFANDANTLKSEISARSLLYLHSKPLDKIVQALLEVRIAGAAPSIVVCSCSVFRNRLLTKESVCIRLSLVYDVHVEGQVILLAGIYLRADQSLITT